MDVKLNYIKFEDGTEINTSGSTTVVSGVSGYSGKSGYSGYSGFSGYSGLSGYSGKSGWSGATGPGMPGSGFSGQILAKKSNTSYDTQWINATPTPVFYHSGLSGLTNDDHLKYIPQDFTRKVSGFGLINSGLTAVPWAEGRLYWDSGDHTLAFYNDISGTTLQVGQEMWIRCHNRTGSTIFDAQCVRIIGSTGQRPDIALARSDVSDTAEVFGITTQDILHGSDGWVTIQGIIRDINTSDWEEGDALYLSDTMAGQLTNVSPASPAFPIRVGMVIYKNANNGKILVQCGPTDVVNHMVINHLETLTGHTFVDNSGYAPIKMTQRTAPMTGSGVVSGDIYLDNGTNTNNKLAGFRQYNGSGWSDISYGQNPVDINRYGFLNQTETYISFDGTNSFTITPTSTYWSYYRTGIKHTISGAKSVTVATPMVDGTRYYLYIDNASGTITSSVSGWTLNDTKVPVATIYWNNTQTPKYIMAEERHTCLIDRQIHRYEHFTHGTEYVNGCTLAGWTSGNTADSGRTFSISTTNIADEDIFLTLSGMPDLDGSGSHFILHRSGMSGYVWQNSTLPFKYSGTSAPYGFIEYDLSGVMTQASAAKFVNYFLFVSNGVSNSGSVTNVTDSSRYMFIPGRTLHTNATDAYGESFGSFDLTGFPLAEGVALYQITYATGGTANSVKGRCEIIRISRITSNIITTSVAATGDHNGLAGLQGGTTGQYYHLTSNEYSRYIPDVSGQSGLVLSNDGLVTVWVSGGTSSGAGTSGYSGYSGYSGTSTVLFGTSTTSNIPETGSKSFTTQAGLNFIDSQPVQIYNDANNYMIGRVTSYNEGTGALVVNVLQAVATGGPYTSWSIYVTGFNGAAGAAGATGATGTSGYSGISGYSGYSGISGYSGYSGSGISGYSGYSGISGYSGYSGISGYSGKSGYSGSGISGYSGYSGISGYSGYSGISGYSGKSGYSGSGISGYSGYSGAAGGAGTYVISELTSSGAGAYNSSTPYGILSATTTESGNWLINATLNYYSTSASSNIYSQLSNNQSGAGTQYSYYGFMGGTNYSSHHHSTIVNLPSGAVVWAQHWGSIGSGRQTPAAAGGGSGKCNRIVMVKI